MYSRMAALSARVLRCAPRRSCFWVSNANHRSTPLAPSGIGNNGCVRSKAWICDFSSTHNTSARSGGSRYNPTMSRTFSTNSGSGDSLNVSVRWGCSPNTRQIASPCSGSIRSAPPCRARSSASRRVASFPTSTAQSPPPRTAASVTVRGGAGTWLIQQSIEALGDESAEPFPDGLLRQPELARYVRVGQFGGGAEHDARPLRECLRRRRATRPTLERRPFFLRELQR